MIEVSIQNPVARAHPNEPVSGKVRIEFIRPKRPFLFWSSYAVGECIQYPKGYGIAYRDEACDRLLFAPMPFNILVGFLVWTYRWFRIGFAVWCWKHRPGR